MTKAAHCQPITRIMNNRAKVGLTRRRDPFAIYEVLPLELRAYRDLATD